MSRKDTIIITVLINTALLAILFAMAIVDDSDKTLDQTDIAHTIAANPQLTGQEKKAFEPIVIAGSSDRSQDEVDNALNDYASSVAGSSLMVTGHEVPFFEEAEQVASLKEEAAPPQDSGSFVEVTVKKGDVLERIARSNGTTVSSIVKANKLKTERLSVGQVLKVPAGRKKNQDAAASAAAVKESQPLQKNEEVKAVEKQYYVIKNGDNPWKIAKQFNVRFEDLLTLNNLDEEKARNLKIGDRIRVK